MRVMDDAPERTGEVFTAAFRFAGYQPGPVLSAFITNKHPRKNRETSMRVIG